jgi:hypothetical protein
VDSRYLMDRRAFIARGIAATGGGALSAVALERLASRSALADKGHHGHSSYGEPQPLPDQRGVEVLALPAGFSYERNRRAVTVPVTG